MRKGTSKKLIKAFLMAVVMTAIFALSKTDVYASSALNKPFISYSPNGKGWTVRADELDPRRDIEGAPIIYRNTAGTLAAPGTGQHYYWAKRTGDIPINRWVRESASGYCIHLNTFESGKWEEIDLPVENIICNDEIFSGWYAYCSDCGGKINKGMVYADRDSIGDMNYFPVYDGLYYYYKCPRCNGLEQGVMPEHICKAVSNDKWEVRYNANTGDPNVNKRLADKIYTYVYHNVSTYEGKSIVADKVLAKADTFTRVGYVLDGWSLSPNGPKQFECGELFTANLEGIFVSNPSTYKPASTPGYDQLSDRIDLYAVWKPDVAYELEIDANGGLYNGKSTEVLSLQYYIADGEDGVDPGRAKNYK